MKSIVDYMLHDIVKRQREGYISRPFTHADLFAFDKDGDGIVTQSEFTMHLLVSFLFSPSTSYSLQLHTNPMLTKEEPPP